MHEVLIAVGGCGVKGTRAARAMAAVAVAVARQLPANVMPPIARAIREHHQTCPPAPNSTRFAYDRDELSLAGVE